MYKKSFSIALHEWEAAFSFKKSSPKKDDLAFCPIYLNTIDAGATLLTIFFNG